MLGFNFDGTRIQSQRSKIYDAGTLVKTSSETSTLLPNSSQDLCLGGLNKDYINSGHKRLGGYYAEVIHYNRSLNAAERTIIENYLGAKYMIPIARDLFNYEATHAGEVTGIGRDDTNNSHDDSQGSAIVRINNPSSLVDVDGSTVEVRLEPVWRTTETGEVGTTDVTFDISGFSPVTPSDLYLLIDRDGDGFADNDVAPIPGNPINGGTAIQFTSINFQDGDYFTLGSKNYDQTPLPVEWVDFSLQNKERSVVLSWERASENNAAFYLLSKSKDGIHFENIAKVQANGTTSSTSWYQSTDNNPFAGTSYYKLTQVDFNGNKIQYGPLSVNRSQEQIITLVPNPTNDSFIVQSITPFTESTTLIIHNSVGKKVREIELYSVESNAKFIDAQLTAGIYFVNLTDENEMIATKKLIIK